MPWTYCTYMDPVSTPPPPCSCNWFLVPTIIFCMRYSSLDHNFNYTILQLIYCPHDLIFPPRNRRPFMHLKIDGWSRPYTLNFLCLFFCLFCMCLSFTVTLVIFAFYLFFLLLSFYIFCKFIYLFIWCEHSRECLDRCNFISGCSSLFTLIFKYVLSCALMCH